MALFYGDLPMWRSLGRSSDDGPDVLQLETNLAALGYTAGGNMTVDQKFTYNTGLAVKARPRETAMGFSSPDTTFDSRDAVYLRGPVRVDSAVTRGTIASSGTSVVTVAVTDDVADAVVGDHEVSSESSPTQQVALQVTTSDQSLFTDGLAVNIELADGTIVGGEGVVRAPRHDREARGQRPQQ